MQQSLADKAAAFTLTAKSTEELIAETRRRIAERRATRAAIETRVVGGFTMERRLALADRRHGERRRFTGEPITGFGSNL